MSNEFSISLERQLMANLAVRVTGIYSTQQTFRVQNNLRPYEVYNIPITNRDPGPDGRLGTADDPGTLITYWDYPAAYAGRSVPAADAGQRFGEPTRRSRATRSR